MSHLSWNERLNILPRMPSTLQTPELNSSESKAAPVLIPEVKQALGSRTFETTPTLRGLLSYLWEHRDEDLNEYKIATEALGRKPDFEPQIDATVRVQISRLRTRLKKFYEDEGAQLPSRITIPLGTHQVRVIEIEPGREVNPPISNVVQPTSFQPQHKERHRWMVPVLSGAILLLLLSNGWMFWMRRHPTDTRNQLPVFWQQFMANGKRTSVVTPNPVFFFWKNRLVARDWKVNDLSKLSNSESLTALAKLYGQPIIARYYTNSSDASAAWRLDRFLDPTGTQIAMRDTVEFSTSDLDWDNNLVTFGNANTLAIPFQSFLDKLSFQMDEDRFQVVDRRPAPGMPHNFQTITTGSRVTTPSIIALLPGATGNTHILLVITDHSAELVAYLLSEAGLKELENAIAAHGHSRYFEAVISTEISGSFELGSTELGSRLVEFKPYPGK